MKLVTVLGTRPEIIKLSCVIDELEKHVDHVLVHTGQNYDYELNEIFFEDLKVKRPDHFLNAAGSSASQSVGNIISLSGEIFEKENPDAILIYGDTNSGLAAIAAKQLKIPIFHFEAGNRCFDQRVPEETNRKILDHISDINLTISEHARRQLISEGLPPDRTIKTGSPMKEVLNRHRDSIEKSTIISKLKLTPSEYFVVSAHRAENIDEPANFNALLSSLNSVAEKYGLPIVVSTHPRTMKQLEKSNDQQMNPLISFLKPMGFFDYVKLQLDARCVISDSGTITEESSILNFPAITIREAHERPEGMDEGTLIMTGLESESILRSIDVVTTQAKEADRAFKIVADYDVDNFSKKVLRIILSYTDYVNRTVWSK